MTYFAITCFVTALLWQYRLVTALDVQKSMKNILETLENSEEYDIVFPVILDYGTNTPMLRARRQVESTDGKTAYAEVQTEHGTGDPLVLKSGSAEEVINNESSNTHKKYVSEGTGSGTKRKTYTKKTRTSLHTAQNTSIRSEETNVQTEGSENNSGRLANKLIEQRKITNSDDKTKNESFDTGPTGNKPNDVTIIEMKAWILEVKTNPALFVRDGLQVEWVTKGRTQSVLTAESCRLQTGIIRGDLNSTVALTTCDSFPTDGNGTGDMTGLIQVKGNSYFVQPLMHSGGLKSQHPHLLYRTTKSLKLQDDQDFGDATESRQADVVADSLNRPKRESYWRHNRTEQTFANTTVREQTSTEETFNVYLVEEPEEDPEHSRAIIEHIRKKLEREETVGYFLDSDMETEGKRVHTK